MTAEHGQIGLHPSFEGLKFPGPWGLIVPSFMALEFRKLVLSFFFSGLVVSTMKKREEWHTTIFVVELLIILCNFFKKITLIITLNK